MLKYNLDASKRGADISEHLYGLFFEDINQAADGGLNAEMVINNSFEFEYYAYDDYDGGCPAEVRKVNSFYWDICGAGVHSVSREGGMHENNPSYLLLDVGGKYRLENPGYYRSGDDLYGMPAEKGMRYNFSMWVKPMGYRGVAKMYLRNAEGVCTDVAEIGIPAKEDGAWTKVAASIVAQADSMARLCILFEGNGKLGVDYVSLLPQDVWGDPQKYQNGKLSRRLVEALKDCHPSFLRFPGGCVVEGDVDFAHQYRWRGTVGPLEQRKQICNVWCYMQSYGIGFYEYFALCEDLGAAPLPVVHCGLLCQVRVGEQRKMGYVRLLPGTPQFQSEVIDNVADLIFFAKGDVSSADENEARWAKIRAQMGHPAPFDLKFIGIGNENWGREYFENFAACMEGVRQYAYKGGTADLLELFGITVVTTCGVDNSPPDVNASWKIINEKYRDTVVDEHIYSTYQWFIDNTKRYDAYDRSGAKVFVGEYAMHSLADGRGRLNGENNLRSALAEAAFLTGCERNSDVVKMTCYAPLFGATYHHRWRPDLIWFNARDVMFTPNYYVQQMFAANTGKFALTDVAPDDGNNAGGLLIGGNRTAIAVASVKVFDRETGKCLYEHAFKDGLGEWKVYPNCCGGRIEGGELIIGESAALNAYYYDAQDFARCNVEISFRRIGGGQSFVAGVGLQDVRDAGTMDCAGYSVCCQYGKERNGYDVAFEKRVDFMRTVCECMGKDKFLGYSPEGNVMRLEYTEKIFAASLYKDGAWHEVLRKNIWKVNGRIFHSATVGEDGKIYLKVVNVSGKDEQLDAVLKNFPQKTTADVMTLHGDPQVTNEIGMREGKTVRIAPIKSRISIRGNVLHAEIKNNSVTVFTIS